MTFIVGIGGTVRPGSSTEAALRIALDAAALAGSETVLFDGTQLAELPMYDPRSSAESEVAGGLVDALRRADGILIASPAYHGGISGLVKNALDYIEELREDPRPYFTGRPVGCISTGMGSHGAAATIAGLRAVVHALRGWPTPRGLGFNTKSPALAGPFPDAQATTMLQELGREVAWAARHPWHEAVGETA